MKTYKCQVEKNEYAGYIVSITQNGYQWSTIILKNLDQLRDVRDNIDKFILEQENKENISSQKKIQRKRIAR